MGGNSSIDKGRHRSKPADTVPNLTWALAESTWWVEKAVDERLLEHLKSNSYKYQELASYYVLLHNLIEQLVTLSVENCKYSLHLNQLTKKRDKARRPFERLEAEKRLERFNTESLRGLWSYDNARDALMWLKRQCELIFERLRLEEDAARIRKEQGQPSLKTNEDKMEKLKAKFKLHERRLMAVNMHYQDRNFSGSIEPDDMPDLSARLFNVIDANKNHRVTADELDQAINGLDSALAAKEKELEQTVSKLQELNMALATVSGRENEAKIYFAEKLQVRVMRTQEVLKELRGEQEQLQEDRDAVFQHFEQGGFVRELRAKLSALKDEDLIPVVEGMLSESALHGEIVKIGLADTDIKLGVGEVAPAPMPARRAEEEEGPVEEKESKDSTEAHQDVLKEQKEEKEEKQAPPGDTRKKSKSELEAEKGEEAIEETIEEKIGETIGETKADTVGGAKKVELEEESLDALSSVASGGSEPLQTKPGLEPENLIEPDLEPALERAPDLDPESEPGTYGQDPEARPGPGASKTKVEPGPGEERKEAPDAELQGLGLTVHVS